MSQIEKPDVIGATRRAETIRAGMVGYVEAMAAIGEAYEQRDWVTLGHKDWDTYCEKEFSGKRLKLSRDERELAILAFRGAGMSVRAIGSALGIPKSTVADALDDVSGSGHLPDEVLGSDGKRYPASPPTVDPAEPEPHADPKPAEPQAPVDSPPPSGPGAEEGGVPADEASPASTGTRLEDPKPAKEKPPVWLDDDPEVIEAHRRRRVSKSFAEGVAFVWAALDPDPVAWLGRSWDPAANPFAGMDSMTKVFAPDGLRRTAEHLISLADHLDEKGETL